MYMDVRRRKICLMGKTCFPMPLETVGVRSHSLLWPTVRPICNSPGAKKKKVFFNARLSLCLQMFVCMRPRSTCDTELMLGSVDITGGALLPNTFPSRTETVIQMTVK